MKILNTITALCRMLIPYLAVIALVLIVLILWEESTGA